MTAVRLFEYFVDISSLLNCIVRKFALKNNGKFTIIKGWEDKNEIALFFIYDLELISSYF